MVKRPTIQQPRGVVHFTGDMSSDGYFLHRIEHSVVVSAIFGHLQVRNSAFLFDKGLRPQVLYSKVGGIVPG